MMQRVIVFVGPDRVGKTEISTALSQVLQIPRFKAASEHDTFLNHQDRFVNQLRYADVRMADFLSQTKTNVIMDRGWPCEMSYSNVLNRSTDMVALGKIDAMMANLGAVVVICSRSSYVGIVDDIDPTINDQKLTQLDAAYRRFMSWTKCRTMVLNVDDENLHRELDDVLKFLGYDELIVRQSLLKRLK